MLIYACCLVNIRLTMEALPGETAQEINLVKTEYVWFFFIIETVHYL